MNIVIQRSSCIDLSLLPFIPVAIDMHRVNNIIFIHTRFYFESYTLYPIKYCFDGYSFCVYIFLRLSHNTFLELTKQPQKFIILFVCNNIIQPSFKN